MVLMQSEKRQTKPVPAAEARVERVAARIADSGCPVLLMGEHGVGKHSLARQIHAHSNRPRSAFAELDSCELEAPALEAALATSGTLYLAEITDLSISLQELIVNTYLHPSQPPACRLICGSSRELLDEVKSWRMREDFYYLISAVTLRIPPLRCRKPEILTIADGMMTQYAKQFDRPKPVLGKELVEHLLEHSWPGNLSELQTAIKTFVAIEDQAISLAAIKAALPQLRSNGHRRPHLLKEATRASSIQIERQLISEVLHSTGGNRKRAALELGISYKALLYKLKQIAAESPIARCKDGVAQ